MKIIFGIFDTQDEPEEELPGITDEDIALVESTLIDNGVEE